MYTTRLLEELDDRIPPRHRLIWLALVAFITLGSAAQSLADRPARAALPPPPLVVIATPTAPAPPPTSDTRHPTPAAPLVLLAPPTVAPPPRVVIQATPAPRVHEKPSDKAGPGRRAP